MGLLLLFLLLALLVSFACSMWESVLLSVTPSYVTRHEQEGDPTGRLLREFKQDIDRPLSAILTLNTIAHTVGAIGVGAQANVLFGSAGLSFLGARISFEAMIAGGATLAILVLSEIIPKTLGATYWERFVPLTVRCLKVLIIALYPFVRLSELITRFLKGGAKGPVFSRADFLAMAELGRQEGRLDASEASVIQNLLAFRETRARQIMTPRTVVVAARGSDTVGDFLSAHPELTVSRLPVYPEDIDTVTGIVLKDDLLAAAARDEHDRRVDSLEREALFVLDQQHLPRLLRQLTGARAQLAVVVDEYGVTQGVVTMEDVVETLLGMEIMDEADRVADMQALARANGNPPPGDG
jgi:CBS domain containing-hemolysin-like protein